MKRISENVVECSNCSSRALLSDVLAGGSLEARAAQGRVTPGAGAAAGSAAGESPDANPRLRLVKSDRPQRTIEAIRRELLDAHRAHVDASQLQEAAEKAASYARHNVVEKLGRITQLRHELVNYVEREDAEQAS